MKNLVSLIVFALVFLGLGAMALMAAPGGADLVAEFNPSETAGSAPHESTAQTNEVSFNAIAIPLDSSASITPFNAAGLAAYHGTSVQKVMEWNATTQSYASYIPDESPPFAAFALKVGGAYMLAVDGSSSNLLSLVGDVPSEGSVFFSFVTPSAGGICLFNHISLPLDRSDLTKASGLAGDMTGVDKIMKWTAATQSYASFIPGESPPFADFDVEIGYPYVVCLNSAAPTTWQ